LRPYVAADGLPLCSAKFPEFGHFFRQQGPDDVKGFRFARLMVSEGQPIFDPVERADQTVKTLQDFIGRFVR